MPEFSSISLVLDGLKFLAGTVVGALITKRVEGKVQLVTHWGSVSAFTLRNPGQAPVTIHTHEVVIRNAGSKAANNVRVTHAYLPDQFNVNPPIPFTVEELPSGQKDIVVPKLVPKQLITISYLYYPPMTFAQIHAGIRSDEGFATPVEMEISEKTPRWLTGIAVVLFLIGCLTLLYLAWRGLRLLG